MDNEINPCFYCDYHHCYNCDIEGFKNPCVYCDCYDEDLGCTMSSFDKSYACPLNQDDDNFM